MDHEVSAAPASPLSPSGEDSWGGMLAGPAAPTSPPAPVSPQAGAKPSEPAQGMDRGAAAAPAARGSTQPRSAAAGVARAGAAQFPEPSEAGVMPEDGSSERRGRSAPQASPPLRPARQASGSLEDAGAHLCSSKNGPHRRC